MHSYFTAAQTNWTASHRTHPVLHLLPHCVSFRITSLRLLSSICASSLGLFNHALSASYFI
jgi:hypothetical protein